jgi:hypothetical protein
MYMYITCKTAILALIGLFAIATVVMNSGAESRGIARSGVESRVVTRGVPISAVCDVLYQAPCVSVDRW